MSSNLLLRGSVFYCRPSMTCIGIPSGQIVVTLVSRSFSNKILLLLLLLKLLLKMK